MEPQKREQPYRVNLPTFEGPLDLLLYLIKRDELDIWDIPISRITDEYLGYLELMSELNLAVAGEFLLMASMLTAIKSRMLVAAQDDAQDEPEIEDPRAPLVERLLEYQRYREAADRLASRACLNRDVFERGIPAFDVPDEAPEPVVDASLYDLMRALKDLLDRAASRELTHQVTTIRISVVDRVHWLHERLGTAGSMSFLSLFDSLESRLEIVITFLALLEMLKANIVTLTRLPEAPAPGADDLPSWRRGGVVARDWMISERSPGDDLPEAFVVDR